MTFTRSADRLRLCVLVGMFCCDFPMLIAAEANTVKRAPADRNPVILAKEPALVLRSSHDGRWIALDRNGQTQLLDAPTQKVLWKYDHRESSVGLHLSKKNNWVLIQKSKQLVVLSITDGSQQYALDDQILLAISPDDRYLLLRDPACKEIRLWKTADQKVVDTRPFPENIEWVQASFARNGSNVLLVWKRQQHHQLTMLAVTVADLKQVTPFDNHSKFPRDIATLGFGEVHYLRDSDKYVTLCNDKLITGFLLPSLLSFDIYNDLSASKNNPDVTRRITAIGSSADGRFLVQAVETITKQQPPTYTLEYGEIEKSANPSKLRAIQEVMLGNREILSVSFVNNGQSVAVVQNDVPGGANEQQQTRLVAGLLPVPVPVPKRLLEDQEIAGCVVSPAGNMAALYGPSLHLLDLKDNKVLWSWKPEDNKRPAITAAKFSGDGQLLLIAAQEQLRVVDAKDGKERVSLNASLMRGNSVDLSPNGKLVAFCDKNLKQLILWDLVKNAKLAEYQLPAEDKENRQHLVNLCRSNLRFTADSNYLLQDYLPGPIPRSRSGKFPLELFSSSDLKSVATVKNSLWISQIEFVPGSNDFVACGAFSGLRQGSWDGKTLTFDETFDQEKNKWWGQLTDVKSLSYSPSGRRAAIGTFTRIQFAYSNGDLQVIDLPTGKQIYSDEQRDELQIQAPRFQLTQEGKQLIQIINSKAYLIELPD